MGIARLEQVSLPYLTHPAWWATMENGHQIIATYKASEVVHLHTVVRTGSINESDQNTGVSHFLEHLMFKGTERYPAGVFDRLLEAIGARVNASTSKDWTQYYVTLPKGADGEYYRLALDLHADMLLHAALPEEEIGYPFDLANPQAQDRRERMVVIEEIKMYQDNPWSRALKLLDKLQFPTHPYRREVIGTADVIAGIPRDDIAGYYRTWYQPANMITIVTGDLDPQATIDEVARNFDFHTATPVLHPVYAADSRPETPRTAHISMPLNVGYVLFGFIGPPSADLRGIIALDVLTLIIGRGKSSRLQLRLVERADTPFFEAQSAQLEYRDGSTLLAYGVVRPERIDEAADLLREEIERLQTDPPSDDEVEKAITRLETFFAAQTETSAGMSFALADSMGRLNSPAHYTEYLTILRSLTRDDLAAAAQTYLAVEHMCVVTVSSRE